MLSASGGAAVPPTLDRAWIERHIPHAGTMCLLERVLHWDGAGIRCEAVGHADPCNPLRAGGRLGAACGIEYAAQAMAIHGALLAQGEPAATLRAATPGYIVAVRAVHSRVLRLDGGAARLEVAARREAALEHGAQYAYDLLLDGQLAQSGRVTLRLGAGPAVPAE